MSRETDLATALDDFHAQYRWLLSLIRDPSGQIFVTELPQAQRLQDYRERAQWMAAFLDFIGHPEARFRSVHVAGTSGKGSVTTMIAALLTACGFQVGDHVSPYLQVPNEKLRIDGQMIRPSAFARLVRDFRPLHERWLAEGGELRYPQAWAALTFLWFAQEQVDWGVVETGVGGRFDPTNALPSALAVITNVDLDHTEVLGESLSQIAWHKAGIIKPGGLAITAETKPEALAVLEEEARRQDAILQRLRYAVDEEGRLTVDGSHGNYRDLRLQLPGHFQAGNAALAIAAVDLLAREHGFSLTRERIEQALSGVRFAGRLEVMQREPLVVLDGAHNPHKMRTLAEELRDSYGGRPITVVLGLIATKDAREVVQAILPLAGRLVATQPQVFGKPSLPAEALASVMRALAPAVPVDVAGTVAQAIALALGNAGPEDVILITGSLYLLGQARDHWLAREELLRSLEVGGRRSGV